MQEAFTTKGRKKEYENVFKGKILPFFEAQGFSRHTKTSKRLFKDLGAGLMVFLFLEYKNRFGCYDITIAYFDAEIGTVYDDEYLAMAEIKRPSFSGDTIEKLNAAVDQWLLELEVAVLPFLEKYTSHQDILEGEDLYRPKRMEQKLMALLESRAKEE